jgi:hypothetical protein
MDLIYRARSLPPTRCPPISPVRPLFKLRLHCAALRCGLCVRRYDTFETAETCRHGIMYCKHHTCCGVTRTAIGPAVLRQMNARPIVAEEEYEATVVVV